MIYRTLIMATTMLALPAVAHAADAPAQPDPYENVDESAIIVTGSRVIANGNNSPTPLTVVSVDQVLQAQPVPVAQALQNLPVFAGSQGQNSGPGGASANGSANVMNLRNMGLLRSLVLYDGHRVPPTSPLGYVDTNMIPQMLLKRVDTVTGGASAVYGSDAVSGVVNFITDSAFEGMKLDAQYGVSDHGDDRTQRIGLAIGRSVLGGRGHFEASYEFYNDPGIFNRFNRQWDADLWALSGSGTSASPYLAVKNARLTSYAPGGLLISANTLSNNYFAANGVLTPFVNGTSTNSTSLQSGGSGDYYTTESLKSAFRSHQLFGRFDYDLSDNIHAYVQGSGTFNYNKNNATPNVLTGLKFSNANPFVSNYASALPSTFTMNALLDQRYPVQPTTQSSQWFAIGDLSGNFGKGYKWEFAVSQSQANQTTRQPNDIDNSRLTAALDAVRDGNNNIVCRVSTTAAASAYAGCRPLNLFGPSAADPAALAWIFQPFEYTSVTRMTDVAGTVSGQPVSTWAGPVTMALSGEWRSTSQYLNSNAQPTDITDCATLGTAYCYSPTKRWGSGSLASRPRKAQIVSEAAYEFDAPLITDMRFARDVHLNGAVRYAHYNTNGTNWAWKIGGEWKLSDGLTFRATRSRDVRAPNLNELYAPLSVGSGIVKDYITGNSNNVPTYSGSNPDLKPEIAFTTTIGAILRPESVPGLSLAVDYYSTTINNAVTTINGSSTAIQKNCSLSGGTSPYCALIVRATPTSDATHYFNVPVNAAQLSTNGVDAELNYAFNAFQRPASFRFLATYQPHLRLFIPDVANIDMGGAAYDPLNGGPSTTSAMRITAMLTISPVENLKVMVMERWRDSLRWNGDPTLVYAMPRIPSVGYTNANFNYSIPNLRTAKADLFLNVQNLFNVTSPIAPSGAIPGASTPFVSGDDAVGRYFTVGVRVRM
jgi:iron complex outermembrane receptor protein